MKQEFLGYICRTWTETVNGWVSDFERFPAEEEARAYGGAHCRSIRREELTREYEIYKDFSLPF